MRLEQLPLRLSQMHEELQDGALFGHITDERHDFEGVLDEELEGDGWVVGLNDAAYGGNGVLFCGWDQGDLEDLLEGYEAGL